MDQCESHPATRVWTGPTSLEKWLSLSFYIYIYILTLKRQNILRWGEQIGAPKALRIKVEDLSKKYQKLQDEELSTSDQPAAGNDPELDYFMVQNLHLASQQCAIHIHMHKSLFFLLIVIRMHLWPQSHNMSNLTWNIANKMPKNDTDYHIYIYTQTRCNQ